MFLILHEQVGSYSHWSSSVGKTIGAKLNELRIPDTPGPGAYSPNSADKPSAPRYTLSPRHEMSNHKVRKDGMKLF